MSITIALDVAIAVYAAALVVILTTGGVDFGWLSMREAAKPILVLWLLVPTRLAIRPYSWPPRRAERMWSGAGAALRAIVNRVPPAVRDATFAFGATQLAAFAVGFFSNLLFSSTRARPFELPFSETTFAQTFAAWDSGWYFDIASRGYYYSGDAQSSVAFFPLYPMAMRAAAWPFGATDAAIWTAGIAISCTAFLAGLVVLHRLTERLFHDREVARRTVLYVAVFPFSFFLTRVYPSSLFFLVTVVAVSAAYASRWWLAGWCGALAALTRPHGMLIGIPLVLMALKAPSRREMLSRLAALVPIPLALAGYSLYVASLAGHPLAWLSSQNQWGYSLGHPPWEQLLGLIARLEKYGVYDYFFTSKLAPFHLFHGAAALLMLAAIPAVFSRLGVPLGAYVLVSVLIPLTSNSLEGNGRYAAVLFPVFMVLGTVQSARVHEALLIICSLFLALFVGLFVTWHPIY